MGENLDIEGRMSVRSPMQWTSGRNAGFSPARPSRLRRPIVEGPFGPSAVNVADQERDTDSLLNWMERMTRRRHETPELGWGTWSLLDTGDVAVLGHRCEWEGGAIVCLHNFTEEPRDVRAAVHDGDDGALLDLLDDHSSVTELDHGHLELKLEGYGYRWFRLQESETHPKP